jgi:hypothetical protein
MSERRSFTVLDAMILIATVGISIWIGLEKLVPVITTAIQVVDQYRTVRLAIHWARLVLLGPVQPFLGVWTVGLLVLHLKHLRPLYRRLALAFEPGFVACCVAVMGMLLAGPTYLINLRRNLTPGLPMSVKIQFWLGQALTCGKAEPGIAVLAAWVTLALCKQWRPRPDWLDRLGRAIGMLWIAMIPINWLGFLLVR